MESYIFSYNTVMKLTYYFILQLAVVWPSIFITQSMAETNDFTGKAYCYIDFNNENKKYILTAETKYKTLYHRVAF